ncbi:hypothetical protein EW146_g9403 [Bondarzewia mesenterica]|uniref:Uncharacterized protein n=1 Tax=Bondarzewia mesenterica TaxID=1095465 RepID=A0A4S4L6X2_9AGAM|nr:hypothetical protein EW146_g9403 [Bondarzewia mesenterica]
MSSSNSSSLGVYILPEAERLTKVNWADWSARIYLVCQVRGLEPYLLGTILPPSARTTITSPLSSPIPPASPASDDDGPLAPELIPTLPSPVLLTQASPYVPAPTAISAFFPISTPATAPSSAITYTTTDSEWRERDTIACAHLVLNVADITGTGIMVTGTAADAWTSLHNRFELQDPVVVQDMRLRLTMTWYQDGTSMVLMTFPVDGALGTVVMTLLTCRDSMVAESVLSSQELRIRAAATTASGYKTYSDSGATYHYFADHRDFVTYEPLSKPGTGRAAGPNGFTIARSGLVVKDAIVGRKRVTCRLQAVHASDMGQNLLSTRQFDREGGHHPPHEDASTNTSPIPQSPTSSTTYTCLPHLVTPSPDQTYATPSFIERFDLPIVVMKTELTPEGVIHYGHPATALPIHPPPLLTDNTIMAEKDFHDAIMSLKQYAWIEGALHQIGEPGLTTDIRQYRALTLKIEEDCRAIERHEQHQSRLTIDRWDVSAQLQAANANARIEPLVTNSPLVGMVPPRLLEQAR